MKTSQQVVNDVIQFKELGISSRDIAAMLNIGKSTVNDIYNRYIEQRKKTDEKTEPAVKDGPKILLLDLETAPSLVATFGRYNQNIGQDNVLQEGGWILTAAYKWLGSDEIFSLSKSEDIGKCSDFAVCHDLLNLISKADAVIAHNGKAFDMKVLETRLLINKLKPLPKVKIIDTLLMARKNYKFNSNKLDSLGKILGLGGKSTHSGIKLWLEVLAGSEEALEKMIEYNVRDVDLLEQVYLKLISTGNVGSSFNAGHYYKDNDFHCPTCGSRNVVKTGNEVKTAVSVYDEVRCLDCGAASRTRKNKLNKSKNLLVSVV